MVLFFAIIVALGIWSAGDVDTGPHHPTYMSDTTWYENELHATTQPWERDHE